ncbi:MAG: hypothetical protein ABJH82_01850 [Polaribacter sp.]|uniref:hypothetical protein n=1 Tax=Polaribacter sp. TaxID=1920175 RepID=UPI0032633CA5
MTITSLKENNISIFNELLHEGKFNNLNDYNRYLNWICGEFTLYQQYNNIDELIIYFPNGWFSINKIESNANDIKFRIEVKSKSSKKGVKILNKINSILTHVKRFDVCQ